MEINEPKILVLYDEARTQPKKILEDVVEPYLGFLIERGKFDARNNLTDLYEKRDIYDSLKGYKITTIRGPNNRFPEFQRDFGNFDFQKIASGVFYIGEELSGPDLKIKQGELFFIYDNKNISHNRVKDKVFDEFIDEISQHTKRKERVESLEISNLVDEFNNLSGLKALSENISLKTLGVFSHSRRMDLRFLTNEVGYLFKIRTLNGLGGETDEYINVFGSRGHSRNVHDSGNGHEH